MFQRYDRKSWTHYEKLDTLMYVYKTQALSKPLSVCLENSMRGSMTVFRLKVLAKFGRCVCERDCRVNLKTLGQNNLKIQVK